MEINLHWALHFSQQPNGALQSALLCSQLEILCGSLFIDCRATWSSDEAPGVHVASRRLSHSGSFDAPRY